MQQRMAHVLQYTATENDSIRICGSPENTLENECNTFYEKCNVNPQILDHGVMANAVGRCFW